MSAGRCPDPAALTSPGNCIAGGFYTDPLDRRRPSVLAETRGHWGRARPVRGIGKLNAGGDAEILAVACAAAAYCTAVGYCSAGGFYKDGAGKIQAFVVNQTARLRRYADSSGGAEVPRRTYAGGIRSARRGGSGRQSRRAPGL